MAETVFYTAHAKSVGGRAGHTESENHVSFDIDMPKRPDGKSREGATTPEDLFAAGYAACFGGALDAVARATQTAVSKVEVRSTVTLTHDNWKDFTLHVVLDVTVSGVSQQTADTLVAQAHQVCPYSRATRNNIEVTLNAHAA